MRGAEQHRLLRQPGAFLALAQHLVGHPARLVGLVVHQHQLRPVRRGLVAVQRLRKAPAGQRDHGVGRSQQRLRAAVVALQRQHRGRWREALGKAEQVLDLGRTEAVDRLRVVAHHGQAPAVGLQRVQDAGLQAVGVLVLVDQHVVEARAHRGGDGGLLHGQVPVQQQVVVVQHALRLLGLGVGVEQLFQPRLVAAAPGVLLRQHLAQRLRAVDGARQDGAAGARQRKARAAVVQAQLGAHLGQQLFGVAAVHHAEVGLQAQRPGIRTQQPCAHAVEGAGPRQLGRRGGAAQAQRLVQQPPGAAGHLGRGAAREGHQQDAPRVGTLLHQASHARGQHQCLARAGAGHHQQRRVAMLHGGALLVVQRVRRGGGRLDQHGATV